MSTFDTKKVRKHKPPKTEDVEPAAPVEVVHARKWSDQQEAVFAWARNPKSNLLVRARAGTGKTTTIVQMLEYLPAGSSKLVAAFNNRIAKELSERVSGNAHVKTLHGHGYGCIKRNVPAADLDDGVGLERARQAIRLHGVPDWRENWYGVKNTASILKRVSPFVPLLNPSKEDVEQAAIVARAYGALDGVDDEHHEKVTRAAISAMAAAAAMTVPIIDFDDMLFIPLARNWVRGTYDFVIIDEAQDMNRAQLEVARRAKARSGWLAVVGDDRQGIYAFNGADSGSIDRLKKEYEAVEKGLTTTYRCPKKVVALAKNLVPDYRAADQAPDGVVRRIPKEQLVDQVQPGDFVLSRLNGPLMAACLEFISAGKRAKVEGRDIGRALLKVLYDTKASTISEAVTRAGKWLHKQLEKAARNNDEEAATRADDIFVAIEALADSCETDNLRELTSKIESLFTDDGVRDDCVTCSTVHKAKGLEAQRVFILADTFKGSWFSAAPSEESNLKYVAITRAMKELVFVNAPFSLEEENKK